ncbi:HAD superfamily hydrolase (TIGR01490 family) [Mumia flava]|uniref:HAD superfamily hydrolase (TIGR01490 family) n=1 Tax=Mumia flava TaxID=1348852 RepID=A0A2M9BHF7_9ACTN|nr:HAD-IB family hydrolase [Mumia flava]PJJ57372.1 HAD superfamily hydrolase (TIGR01490 family) [Mumia flava]
MTTSGATPTPSAAVRSAAFFDLDKTIIARSSTLAFSRHFYGSGLLNRRAVLRSAYAQFVFALSGASEDQMQRMRAYLTDLVRGWDVRTVREVVAETLHSVVDPLVYEEAVALIADHHSAGRDVVIVSASGSEVVEPIGAMLGADHVIATRLVEVDGAYNGEIDFYAYGENKALAVRELADEHGYDLGESYAYSDSETDVPMLAEVGNPVAVNPDRALRRVATEEGWPVLEFDEPVALRSRVTLESTGSKVAVAGLAAAAVSAAAGVALHQIKRRRPE